MMRTLCLIAAATAFLGAHAGTASAQTTDPTREQQTQINMVSGVDGPGAKTTLGWVAAQTITVGTTGFIDEVSLYVERASSATGPLRVDLRSVSNGVPGSVRVSVDVPAANIPIWGGWVTIRLPHSGATWFPAGSAAIVVSASGHDHFGWFSQIPSSYSRGVALYSQDSGPWRPYGDGYDFTFKTHISPSDRAYTPTWSPTASTPPHLQEGSGETCTKRRDGTLICH